MQRATASPIGYEPIGDKPIGYDPTAVTTGLGTLPAT